MSIGLNDTPGPPQRLPKPNDPCWCGSGKKYKRCHQVQDGQSASQREEQIARARLQPGRVSPARRVPAHIPRPDYADAADGRPGAKVPGERMAPDQIARMRRACRAAAQVLQVAGRAVRPGVTTDELDAIAHDECLRLGGYPSPLNYFGFPKSICTSVNEVICHGIPDNRPLRDGDIVNLDITVFLEGMHGDTSATFLVGTVDEESKRLVRVTRECMEIGIEAAKPGLRIHAIGRAIEDHATKHGYGVVRAYCGHGIGETFHTSLQVPHYFDPTADTVIQPGMVFTIEPMITQGTWRHRVWDDGWTAVTADSQRTAQFEHTVLITDGGAEVLTKLE